MRIGLVLDPGEEPRQAREAESIGLFGVLVEAEHPGTEMIAAGYAASSTDIVRIIVRVPLGHEHPVTIAEEIAVLDNASGGRIAVLADSAALGAAEASEDIALLRRCWAARPLRHLETRWRVPAGLPGHAAPDRIEVTPKPAQIEVPVWLTGHAAPAVARATGLPVLAESPDACDAQALVQPALAALAGVVEEARDEAARWAMAGATHLLARPSGGMTLDALARLIVPEVAMPGFPRILAHDRPAAWPGSAGH